MNSPEPPQGHPVAVPTPAPLRHEVQATAFLSSRMLITLNPMLPVQGPCTTWAWGHRQQPVCGPWQLLLEGVGQQLPPERLFGSWMLPASAGYLVRQGRVAVDAPSMPPVHGSSRAHHPHTATMLYAIMQIHYTAS
jgi:hypothetical protein